MDISGEYQLPVPPSVVWGALNDIDVLREAIPGCEAIERTADDRFTATIKAKVGPISARFSGNVQLTDIEVDRGYTLVGEGAGGAAGFAKGRAIVILELSSEGTLLKYKVDAQIGGKLAQVGTRLIASSVSHVAAQFFSKFSEIVTRESGAGNANQGQEVTRSKRPGWIRQLLSSNGSET